MPLALQPGDQDVTFAFIAAWRRSKRVHLRMLRTNPNGIKLDDRILGKFGCDMAKGIPIVMDCTFADFFLAPGFMKKFRVHRSSKRRMRIGPPHEKDRPHGLILNAYDYNMLSHLLGMAILLEETEKISTYMDKPVSSYCLDGICYDEFRTTYSRHECLYYYSHGSISPARLNDVKIRTF